MRSFRPSFQIEANGSTATPLKKRLPANFNELEVLRYPTLNPSNIHDVCDVLGLEHLDLALNKGRGAILMIGHFGANQMIMPALGHRGYPIHQLSAPPTVWADILPERANPLWRQKLELRWQLEQGCL